jgi:hypothetical protein
VIFSNFCCYKKFNAQIERKIIIIPFTDFWPNTNSGVKLFYAWIYSVTKGRVSGRATLQMVLALAPGANVIKQYHGKLPW